MSRPSTPSDSSVLALHDFTYERRDHAIEYPHDHHESQPQTPVSPRTPRRSHARAYSFSSIDRGLSTSRPRRDEEGAIEGEEEYNVGLIAGKRTKDDHMDGFTYGEITVMAGSSLMVLGLIGIAAILMLGKVKL